MIAADKDLRNMFGTIRDQDPRPTCMAFATSDLHQAVRTDCDHLSVEWVHYHALKRDGGAIDEGTTMKSMLETLQIDGQPL